MSINDFKKFISKYYKKILPISLVVSILFGLVSLTFPKSFVSEGTFVLIPNFENTKNSNQNNIYNYDGYYLDQISQSYSKTITGLIETPEFKKKVSNELGSEISYKNLFLLNLTTNFKEIAPRVLVLNVKSNSQERSEKMFSVYEKHLLIFAEKYNSQKVFKLERLDNFTNTFENSIPTYLYFFTSFFLTISVLILFYFLKETKNVRKN